LKNGFFSFTAPRLSKTTIWEQADTFRIKYVSPGIIPIPISDIIEFKLGMNIVPIPGLKTSGDIETLLLGTLDTVVVDSTQFLEERFQNRMRFSLAHEIGHFVLHGDIIKRLRPASVEEWIKMMEVIGNEEYIAIEQQAYEFAGRLLVPHDRLVAELESKKEIINKLLSEHPGLDHQAILEHLPLYES
jgi:hypothetical protein